jgi:hypothetical protein
MTATDTKAVVRRPIAETWGIEVTRSRERQLGLAP